MRLAPVFLLFATVCTAQMPCLDGAAIERSALEELKATHTPGAAIAIVTGNRIVFAKGFGVANIETNAPLTPDMLFRMGSTTKMFTGATVVSLALDGKLDLNAPVGRYIPGIDPALGRVTAHQLLSNTGGMRDSGPFYNTNNDADLGIELRKWKADWLFTEPGKIYSYSSPGFWMAGLLAESVGGKPYADVVADRILRPLGMTRSAFRPTMAMTWPLALGHVVQDGKAVIVRPATNATASWPAGSMYSSVEELARFVIAFLNEGKIDGEQVLKPELVEALSKRHAEMPGEDAGYGYGLAVWRERGLTWLQHGGFTGGYGSSMIMVPERKFGMIVQGNSSGATLPKTTELIVNMMLELEPRKATPAESHPLTESDARKYVGTYANGDEKITLKWEGGALVGALGTATMKFTKSGKDFVAGESDKLIGVMSAGRAEYVSIDGRAFRRVLKN